MRLLGLAALLFAHIVLAGPPCPFDAKVRALADDPAALKAIAKALRQGDMKRWIDGTRANCKVETNLRFIRMLEGLSQRCAMAVVEMEMNATDCRTFTITNGAGGPEHAFALVAADAKGTLQPVWTLWKSESSVPLERSHGSRTPEVLGPPPAPGPVSRVDCGQAVGTRDGGSPALLAIVSDPDLRFEGCTLLGIPEETVRRAMQTVLEKNDSTSTSCQFYEEGEVLPTCAVTTQVTAERVAVISSGGFESGGVMVSAPPHFVPAAAYFELTDAGPRWLCNDLALEGCLSLKPALAARQGCTPPAAKQALLKRAATESCRKVRDEAWIHELPLGAGSGEGLQVERLALEHGLGISNEEFFAPRVVDSATALARCSKSLAAYDGAIGTFVVHGRGSVVVQFAAEAGDEDCVQRTVIDSLRSFQANSPRDWGMSIYRFRLGLSHRDGGR
jgi:hypothetical protein